MRVYPEPVEHEIYYLERHLYYLQTARLTTDVGKGEQDISLSSAEWQIFNEMRQKLIELTQQRRQYLEKFGRDIKEAVKCTL